MLKPLLLLALLAGCHRAPKHKPPPLVNAHGAGIDREMVALKAMYAAPEGPTPCESAYNAFAAGEEAGRAPGKTPLVLKLAPRDEFLGRCRALPAAAQPCLVPAYSRGHREECVKARPAPELLAPMFELKPMTGVQAGERDADSQFMSTSKH